MKNLKRGDVVVVRDFRHVFHRAVVWECSDGAVAVVSRERFAELELGLGTVFPIFFRWDDVMPAGQA
jgi:hypothetical protein